MSGQNTGRRGDGTGTSGSDEGGAGSKNPVTGIRTAFITEHRHSELNEGKYSDGVDRSCGPWRRLALESHNGT